MSIATNLICVVCGDRAYGTNFDVITCPSCKVFFRRNAIKDQGFKCYFDKQCQVNVASRKFCVRCRLDKCYEMGMKKDYILILDELNKECKSQTKNKPKTTPVKTKTNSVDHMSPTHSINAKINAGASIYKSNTSSATSSINGNNSNSNSETTFPLEIPETFPEFEESLSNFTYLHFEYRQHLERQFSIIPVLTVERPIGGGDYSSHLNDTECHKLRTLVTLFSEPINPAILTPTGVLYCEMYATIGHNLELLMVDVIRKCNRLDDFANICESDRYNLIKYGCVELSYMRNISRLDYNQDSWTHTTFKGRPFIKTNGLDLEESTFYLFENIFYTLNDVHRNDPVVFELLMAIVLFSADKSILKHREIVRLQQHVYMYLLQRYLLLRSGSEMDGRTKFASLMKTVIDLKYFAQKHRERIETFTNRNLVPNGLLTELFDLKCNVDICYSDTI